MKYDNVNNPKHYADSCSIECIDAMVITFGYEAVMDFCLCNAYKYLWRHKNKNGYEDLEKARWYMRKVTKLYDDYLLSPTVTKTKIDFRKFDTLDNMILEHMDKWRYEHKLEEEDDIQQ